MVDRACGRPSATHDRLLLAKKALSTPPRKYLSVGGSRGPGCVCTLRLHQEWQGEAPPVSRSPYVSRIRRADTLRRTLRRGVGSSRPMAVRILRARRMSDFGFSGKYYASKKSAQFSARA